MNKTIIIIGSVLVVGAATFFIVKKLKKNNNNEGIGDSAPKELTEVEKLFSEMVWVNENRDKSEYKYTTNTDGSVNEKGTELHKRNNAIIKEFEKRGWEFYEDHSSKTYYIIDKSKQPYSKLIEQKF